ncbi:MAG TPA: HAMP domain-containing protein [Mucilaginibacter sp.]|jgi:nitrogen fixation/metabolism regulation signal transduction histidine kinase|nr:HAMP domain-containing protein [Mucilaginibacter sp.]
MKIKTKLLLGFGLLFVVVVFFGVVSIYYIENISENSKSAIKNNYETLTFTRNMRSVLDKSELPLSTAAATAFDNALKKQEHNITEPGEKEATAGVRQAFTEITDPASGLPTKQQAEKAARIQLNTIDGLNMKAIVQKNNYINNTVSKASLYLSGIVFATFLILFIFIINFPGFILNPLNQFIDGVHELREKNYDVRLEFSTGDEFAALAVEFNKMAADLSQFADKNLTKVLCVENQLKILMEEIPEATFGLNEKQEVLFMNTAATSLFKLDHHQVHGLKIHDVVKDSHLLNAILDSKAGEQDVTLSPDGRDARYQIKKFEIVAPNLKPKPFDTMQFAGYPAGMVYIIRNIEEPQPDAVKPE